MKNKQAFTLIELLVVVLIIGILAAVALPQYQKAVEKARGVEAISLLKTSYQSYVAYYLANGTVPTDWAQLDVTIPWTGHYYYSYYSSQPSTRSNENWSMDLYADTEITRGICIVRLTGNYAGGGFCIFHTANKRLAPNVLYCIERTGGRIVRAGARGSYCGALWKATYTRVGGNLEVFSMP